MLPGVQPLFLPLQSESPSSYPPGMVDTLGHLIHTLGLPTSEEISSAAAGASRAIIRTLTIVYRNPVKAFRPGLDPVEVLRWKAVQELRHQQGPTFTTFACTAPRRPTGAVSRWQIYKYILTKYTIKDYMLFVIPPVAINAALGTILFSMYTESRSFFDEKWLAYVNSNTAKPHSFNEHSAVATMNAFRAGMVAGSIYSVFSCPIDLASWNMLDKLKRQSALRSPAVPSVGLLSSAQDLYSRIGVRGLFSGFSIALAKASLGYALFFSVYERTLEKLQGKTVFHLLILDTPSLPELSSAITSSDALTVLPKHSRPHFSSVVAAGALAGSCYQFVSHPLSAIKHEALSRSIPLDKPVTRRTLAEAARALGLTGAFVGFSTSLLRALPTSVLIFVLYESLRQDEEIEATKS